MEIIRSQRRTKGWYQLSIVSLIVALLTGCNAGHAEPESPEAAATSASGASQTISVSGEAVHFFTTAVVHSQDSTETGMIQRSTDVIKLTGDLNGYVLYHPVSTFDFARGTLVNRGTQFFSGTIAGSEPVVMHDDRFRFEHDPATGETIGEVHFSRSDDMPRGEIWYECILAIVGVGATTPEGDGIVDYSGECTRYGDVK